MYNIKTHKLLMVVNNIIYDSDVKSPLVIYFICSHKFCDQMRDEKLLTAFHCSRRLH